MSDSENLGSRLAGFNPFSKSKRSDDNDEQGEEITSGTVAGGGHSARRTAITKHDLRVSHALKSFLVNQKVLSSEDLNLDGSDEQTETLKILVNKQHIDVPPHLTDRSHPLPEYFISSSHNTYLMAHQLIGTSSAQAYENVLNAGSRCVEIDAWDNEENLEEPKVTHGYTLVSNISFRSVCETIRDVFDKECAASTEEQGYRAAPVMLSLENHCAAHGQLRLVEIMKEIWGDRLLSEAIRQKGHDEELQPGDHGHHVELGDLGSKIVVIVEHHIPESTPEESADTSSSDDEGEEQARQAKAAYREKKEAAPTTGIIPELADLGVYAQSVKPSDNSWFAAKLKNGPHHHLINVSELGLLANLPTHSQKITEHNAHHLMRVFPKGTRISSKNLDPVPFWGVGAQICALNWQTFGAGMQINEALFSGSDGYVLKPAALRAGGSGVLSTGKLKKLRLHIAGATDVPVPPGYDADSLKPYVSCLLTHPDDLGKAPTKRKTSPYKQHKLGFFHKGENPTVTDPIWDEILEWEYVENELVFLRLLIKDDASFATNPKLAVAAVRLSYSIPEWRFIRMLDLKGRETTCSILVKFRIEDL